MEVSPSPPSSSPSSPSPSPPSHSRPRDSEMNSVAGFQISGAEDSAGVWDWGDLLDFTVDGDLSINWNSGASTAVAGDPPEHSPPLPPMADGAESAAEKVRKRDPRLSCTNFLAGLIPCACPEVDERLMELEEEEAGHDKKRQRTRGGSGAGAGVRAAARCQVPACGADIKELKGYHRRHRVCLKCANAVSVVIGGEEKRYCQQCGKFHILPDFDEGKRSCRRKLERHNNRRRRKPVESKGAAGKESPGDIQSEDASGDGEAGKDSSQTDSQMIVKETCVESEGGRVSAINTAPDVNSDGVVSLLDSGETQLDGGKYNSKHGVSVSYSNKSAYSSLCPTGRISFKLYDWNPAEFPRRLRHQIFQWLANMPIELEGYIRPGCIILTVFVAMPRFMWIKLSEDPVSYVHNFVVAPGGMLSGRGNILVYLNNMVFQVLKGGSSVIKANVGVRAPRLHYVHPICFEAGKPMEFVACGSNLFQPKLRFLVSFSGKYLAHNYSPASSDIQTEWSSDSNFNKHQLYQIQVPHTEANHFGPVFIEVENEAGLSNFIPVLIGDKETCLEMKVIQQRLDESLVLNMPCVSPIGSMSNRCEASSLRQTAFSEVIVDIAWLLKKPGSEAFQPGLTTFQVQRLECLLNFLIAVESTTILEKILRNLKTSIDKIKSKGDSDGISDAYLRLLQKYMDDAHQRRWPKLQATMSPRKLLLNKDLVFENGLRNEECSVSFPLQDTEITVDCKTGDMVGFVSDERSETILILSKERVSKANQNEKCPIEASCHTCSVEVLRSRYKPVLSLRPTLCLIAIAAVCFGVCSIILRPHKVSEFAVSIRRCLLNKV